MAYAYACVVWVNQPGTLGLFNGGRELPCKVVFFSFLSCFCSADKQVADDMSVFYKNFLDQNFRLHVEYQK